MPNVWVTDITDLENLPPHLAQGPADRMARYLGAIVSASSVLPVGMWVDAALWCRRRPRRRRCPGHIRLRRQGEADPVEWYCSHCGDRGFISNWRGSTWDLSRLPGGDAAPEEVYQVIVSREELHALRQIMVLDGESQRLVDGAVLSRRGILIRGSADDLDNFLGYIAAGANHESNRRRARILYRVYDKVDAIIQRSYTGSAEEGPEAGTESQGATLSPELERLLSQILKRPKKG